MPIQDTMPQDERARRSRAKQGKVPKVEEKAVEDKTVIMNALLAEFNAMRAEIIFRATTQATLMQINITAAGVLASFALPNTNLALTMIIIPILSPILGILWLDHDATIIKLGQFIKTEIKEAYAQVVPRFKFPDYEKYAEKRDSQRSSRFAILNFTAAVFASFCVLPMAALLYVTYVISRNPAELKSLAFLAPAALAILLILAFVAQFVQRFGPLPRA